ncbi:hypothetical protein E3N88_08124 [Mikania micrantha]|uniref:Uncharacterized protein n=1 Tax=Mikania micrantha TaxID=192012 RepID=A0A5N6PFB7_9ASTR|nr:hypothetical protein E3N88_08124 [Mikania micrantha]
MVTADRKTESDDGGEGDTMVDYDGDYDRVARQIMDSDDPEILFANRCSIGDYVKHRVLINVSDYGSKILMEKAKKW